jgi:hypothetical protein
MTKSWRTVLAKRATLAWMKMSIVTKDADGTANSGIVISPPRLLNKLNFQQVVPESSHVGLNWTSTFWFGCRQPLTIQDGIYQRPNYASSSIHTYFNPEDPSAFASVQRGGLIAGSVRQADEYIFASDVIGSYDQWGNLYQLFYDEPAMNVDISDQEVTRSGATYPFGKPSRVRELEYSGDFAPFKIPQQQDGTQQ